MPRPARKRIAPDARRELIEAAAARLFAERGYGGTTLDDIASHAHVTKPMVYRHFESKKALYLALLARHRDDMPSFLEQGRSRSRERHAALGTVEQPDAKLLLELAHLLADRGLRDVKAFRCLAEMKLLRDGDEVPQMAEFHDWFPPWREPAPALIRAVADACAHPRVISVTFGVSMGTSLEEFLRRGLLA